MAKAKRNIEAKLKLVNVLWEVVDARLPLSSYNPIENERVKSLVLLNKCDLADDVQTREWLSWFKNRGISTVQVNGKTGVGTKVLKLKTDALLRDLFDRQVSRGILSRRARVMIVGIPNVGKSALINRLAGKHLAVTGDRPGVTRGEQWVKISPELELLDTPGVLLPKLDTVQMGMNLAISGAIKREILPLEDVALYLIEYLQGHYPASLAMRYNIEVDSSISTHDLLTTIGKKRGCLLKGGVVDLIKASNILLDDLQDGRLGRITLEYTTSIVGSDNTHNASF